MSYAKFAPITAGLLARKGEAAPSLGAKRIAAWTNDLPAMREPVREFHTPPPPAPLPPPPVPMEFVHHEMPVEAPRAALPSALHADKPRRVVISLTPCEFERLGIAAVKKNQTRHDLVRDTVNIYLQQLAAELNARCACLNDGPCCAGTPHQG